MSKRVALKQLIAMKLLEASDLILNYCGINESIPARALLFGTSLAFSAWLLLHCGWVLFIVCRRK